jgi:hypothetical protein
MDKETIIFFEQLGFGWVLDTMMLKEIKLTRFDDECMTDNSLIQIIENILTETLPFNHSCDEFLIWVAATTVVRIPRCEKWSFKRLPFPVCGRQFCFKDKFE